MGHVGDNQGGSMQLLTVHLEKPKSANVILGQSHFIKTVEDLHEALVTAVPGIQFGLAFCEASPPALVRSSGTSEELTALARKNALALSAGHVFIILLGNAFPINVLKAVQGVQEVCSIFCATANPVEVILAETELGRGVLGVVDGVASRGVESDKDVADRKAMLRKFGYKAN
jgi:adenosine/AMP kinase